ncbi:Chromatin assembly factor 1 subunit A protein [Rutstroemia sp. NJR-2017a WRK4]|nr:Chromatin assembly factor 1 subunit A protein [Rutstroemia sp. NJR-2017a WRK4]
MSTSQESPRQLKRDFEESFGLEAPFRVDPAEGATLEKHGSQPNSPLPSKEPTMDPASLPTPPVSIQSNKRASSPARSTTSTLSELDSSIGSLRGNSPLASTAFAALDGDGSKAPPPKKPKLSFAEKEAKKIEKQFRDQERARERERKESEKQAQLEEKRQRDKEKDEEKKRKDAEREAERAAKEEKKRVKDAEKKEKEEKKQRIEEEKRKKAASQKTLSSFFGTPASAKSSRDRTSASPAPSTLASGSAAANAAQTTPVKKEISPYEKMFPSFFIQNGVTLAPINRFSRDKEASQSLQATIDEYLSGSRSPGRKRHFNATELFHMMDNDLLPRGKSCVSVREIMADLYGDPSKPIDLTTDSQNTQIKRTRDTLKRIPMKFLKFQEDVRPPYQGTYTKTPVNGMARLARNPMRRDLPKTDYDYDSEAEWIEDEDAEDLNSEGEEDDEGPDDAEDMDGFLDDENDDLPHSRRMVIQGDLEPVSTGLCWEDRKKRSTNVKMMAYRMEFVLDPSMKSIDPFATHYWEPSSVPVSSTRSMDPPRLPLHSMKSTNSNSNPNTQTQVVVPLPNTAHPSKPAKTFFTPASSSPSSSSSILPSTESTSKPKKLLPDSDLPAFKAAIDGSDLSKIGLVEVLKKKFPGRTGGAIKATLDLVAKRVGAKEAEKRWVLV